MAGANLDQTHPEIDRVVNFAIKHAKLATTSEKISLAARGLSCSQGRFLLHCFKRGCSFFKIASAGGFSPQDSANDFPKPESAQDRCVDNKALNLAKARSIWNATSPLAGRRSKPICEAEVSLRCCLTVCVSSPTYITLQVPLGSARWLPM